MLVISRKESEDLLIIAPDGTEIVVRVALLDRKKVRLGVTAPREYKIVRRELLTEAA